MTRQREHAADGIDRVYEGALAGGGGDEVSDLAGTKVCVEASQGIDKDDIGGVAGAVVRDGQGVGKIQAPLRPPASSPKASPSRTGRRD